MPLSLGWYSDNLAQRQYLYCQGTMAARCRDRPVLPRYNDSLGQSQAGSEGPPALGYHPCCISALQASQCWRQSTRRGQKSDDPAETRTQNHPQDPMHFQPETEALSIAPQSLKSVRFNEISSPSLAIIPPFKNILREFGAGASPEIPRTDVSVRHPQQKNLPLQRHGQDAVPT